MAFDRPDDDFEAGEARFEQHLRNGGSGSDVPAARPEPAEPRTHEEYYQALRATDGGSSDASPGDGGSSDASPGDGGSSDASPGDGGSADDKPADASPADGSPADGSPADGRPGEEPHVADSRTDHSGWDSIDAANRPSLDALRVSPERTTHILDGDADGSGGHRHGIGNPGKTEFPASWDDEKIIDALLDVAHQPDHPPRHQEWNDRWVARGTRDDVEVVAVIARDGRIWSGWPTPGGPGVVKNPKER
jgi:Bacterial EndoU nuclease